MSKKERLVFTVHATNWRLDTFYSDVMKSVSNLGIVGAIKNHLENLLEYFSIGNRYIG